MPEHSDGLGEVSDGPTGVVGTKFEDDQRTPSDDPWRLWLGWVTAIVALVPAVILFVGPLVTSEQTWLLWGFLILAIIIIAFDVIFIYSLLKYLLDLRVRFAWGDGFLAGLGAAGAVDTAERTKDANQARDHRRKWIEFFRHTGFWFGTLYVVLTVGTIILLLIRLKIITLVLPNYLAPPWQLVASVLVYYIFVLFVIRSWSRSNVAKYLGIGTSGKSSERH